MTTEGEKGRGWRVVAWLDEATTRIAAGADWRRRKGRREANRQDSIRKTLLAETKLTPITVSRE